MSEQQASLFSDSATTLEPAGAQAVREVEHVSTGAEIKRRDPTLYQLAVALFFQDSLSVSEIARRTGLPRNTVSAIVRVEGPSQAVDRLRSVAADDWRFIARRTRDELLAVLSELGSRTLVSIPAPELAQMAARLAAAGATADDRAQILSAGSGCPPAGTRDAGSSLHAQLTAIRIELSDEFARRMGLGGENRAGGEMAARVVDVEVGPATVGAQEHGETQAAEAALAVDRGDPGVGEGRGVDAVPGAAVEATVES